MSSKDKTDDKVVFSLPKVSKQCRHCYAEKPLDDFNDSKGSADGKQSWCKDCMKLYYEKKKLFGKVRTCRKCNEIKPVSDFDGKRTVCKQCMGIPVQLTIDNAIQGQGSAKTFFCDAPKLSDVTDEELLQELRKRGYDGKLYRMAAISW